MTCTAISKKFLSFSFFVVEQPCHHWRAGAYFHFSLLNNSNKSRLNITIVYSKNRKKEVGLFHHCLRHCRRPRCRQKRPRKIASQLAKLPKEGRNGIAASSAAFYLHSEQFILPVHQAVLFICQANTAVRKRCGERETFNIGSSQAAASRIRLQVTFVPGTRLYSTAHSTPFFFNADLGDGQVE